MRPVLPALERRILDAVNPTRPIVEARVEGAADIRQRVDQWLTVDGGLSANLEVLADGGLRLKATAGAAVGPTTVTSSSTYFRAYETGIVSPYIDPIGNDGRHRIGLQAYWEGTTANILYGAAQAWLHPRFDTTKPKYVQTWSCEIYKLGTAPTPFGGLGLTLQPLMSALAPASGETAGFVVFNFVDAAGKFVGFHPDPFYTAPATDIFAGPRPTNQYLILIHGYDAKGNAATNIGWGYDSGQTTFTSGSGANLLTLQGKDIYLLDLVGQGGASGYSSFGVAQLCAFQFIPHAFAASATATFKTGSPIDLLTTPASAPELVGRAELPTGTSVLYEAAVDPAGGFTTFKDGQTTADIGLATQQKYDMRVTLTASPAGDRSPIVRGLGARVVGKVDLGDLVEVVNWNEQTDPITHKGEVEEYTIRVLHDGERDYRDAISLLLSQNPPGKFYFRIYIGDRSLSKDQWLHLDDGFPDDEMLEQAYVDLPCVSCLSLLRQALPVLKSDLVAIPTADASNPGVWTASTGTLLYPQIADVTSDLASGFPDDTTYIQSPANPVNADYFATLSALSTPQQVVGATIQFRAAVAVAGQSLTCQVALREGSTIRAFKQVTVNVADTGQGSYTPYQYALTAAEQASIGNWGNLNFRIRANGTGQIRVGWARLVVLGLRSPLIYPSAATPGNTPQTCMDDLIKNQVGLDARYQGPRYVDTSPVLPVAKTISNQPSASVDLTKAKNELDALAWIAGWFHMSSQGRLVARPFYQVTASTDLVTGTTTAVYAGLAGPIRAVIGREEIEPISVTAGWRQRIPLFAVPWGWNGQNFAGEAQVINAPALAFYGQALVDPETRCPPEVSQWIAGDGLARALATRHGQSFGLGMMVWRFRTTYGRPWLERGDVIAIETDQFLGYDPIATRAIAGRVWATGVIVGRYDVLGREWAVWIQSLSAIRPISSALILPPVPQYTEYVLNNNMDLGLAFWSNIGSGGSTLTLDTVTPYPGARQSLQLRHGLNISASAQQVNDGTDPPVLGSQRWIPVTANSAFSLRAAGHTEVGFLTTGKVIVTGVSDFANPGGFTTLAELVWTPSETAWSAKEVSFIIPPGTQYIAVGVRAIATPTGAGSATFAAIHLYGPPRADGAPAFAPIPFLSNQAPGANTPVLGTNYPGGGTGPTKWIKLVSPDDGTVVLVPAWPT